MFTLTSLPSKVVNFFKSLKNFPAEVILTLIVFACAVYCDHAEYEDRKTINQILLLFPACFAVTFALRNGWYNRTKSTLSKCLYLVSPFLVFLAVLLPTLRDEPYVASLLLSFLLVLSCRWHYDNHNFAADAVNLFSSASFSAAISLLVTAAYYAIVVSIWYLFNLKGEVLDKILFEDGGVFILYVLFPLLFVYRDEQNKELSDILPAFLNFILTYIFIPALLIYTVILYAYAAKILFTWNLPQGYVGWMVLAYLSFAFVVYVAHTMIKQNKVYQLFFKFFPFISIVPVLLLAVGLCRRISDYGLTEDRIYLSAFSICITLFLVFLCVKRLNHYLLMVAISAVAIIVLVYVPNLTAKDLAYADQLSRVNTFVEKYGLLDASHKHFKADKDIPKAALTDTSNLRSFRSSYYYVTGYHAIIANKSDSLYGRLPNCIENYNDDAAVDTVTVPTLVFRKVAIDVHEYPYAIIRKSFYNGDFIVKSKDKTIFSFNKNAFIKEHKKQLLAKECNKPELFTLKNDSVMIVIDKLEYTVFDDKIGGLSIQTTIFAKHPYTDIE